MKVVIVGKEKMLANLILGAVDANAEIVGVFRYDYLNKKPWIIFLKDLFNPSYEVSLIKQLKLKQLKMKSVNCDKFRKFLLKNNVDIMIVGLWKEKIKKETFDIPKIASVNLHPGLLPQYRGPNPYLQTILNGEKETGATLHLIDKNFDTGAILAQTKVEITDVDTSFELQEKINLKARGLICDFLTSLDTTIITPIKQNEQIANYYTHISGLERMLNFNNSSADEISRIIRALHPFLPCYITYKDKFFIVDPYKFKILEKTSEQNPNSIIAKDAKKRSISIVCADNKVICFENLKLYNASIFTKHFINKKVEIKN